MALDSWPPSHRLQYSFTGYEYYPNTGLRSVMIDPYGFSTRYEYDGGSNNKGYLTKVKHPPYPGSTTTRDVTYVRNNDGTASEKVDATSRKTTYEYDKHHRVKKTNYGVVSGTPTFSVETTYDANGNVATVKDGRNNTTTYTYDENNRLTAVLDARSKTTSYEYYVNGLFKKITDPNSRTTTYTYDRRNQLVSEADTLNNFSLYAPDDRGNIIGRLDANGVPTNVWTVYTYDAGDRLTKIDYPTGTDVTFTYNNDNQRTQMVDGAGTSTYTYNELAQLTSATTPLNSTPFKYEYDAAGQVVKRTSPVSPGGSSPLTVTYSYLPGGLLGTVRAPLVHPANTTYFYDAAGRSTVTISTANYGYDNAGRLNLRREQGAGRDHHHHPALLHAGWRRQPHRRGRG